MPLWMLKSKSICSNFLLPLLAVVCKAYYTLSTIYNLLYSMCIMRMNKAFNFYINVQVSVKCDIVMYIFVQITACLVDLLCAC